MTDSAPRRRLRVLHLEDSELDHQLVLAQLLRSGLDVEAERVDTAAAFEAALERGGWDVVLSDFNLPGYSGLDALEHVRERHSLLPFILVSGAIGEDVAVQAMRRGASDYLLKNRLARLGPATLHAIEAQEAVRAKAAADVALAESQRRLRELAQHLQASIEMERAAIAREIHDDVGGALTALRFELAWIARHVQDAGVQQHVTAATETLSHAIGASQRIMHNLRPAILEQGLVAALQWMTSRFEKRTGIATSFRSSHEQLQLPPGVPLVAYRTAQEALTNISKHAQASRVELDLSLAGGVLSLEVSDNGRGIAASELAKAQSFGIRGLHERAGTVGGWIELGRGASGGTTLLLSIPLDAEAPEDVAKDGVPLPDAGSAGFRPGPRTGDPTLWGEQ